MSNVRSAALVLSALLVWHPSATWHARPTVSAAPHPIYLILLDEDSFNVTAGLTACMVTAAFVDGLDPSDRVAVVSVAYPSPNVTATTDRLVVKQVLQGIIGRRTGPARTPPVMVQGITPDNPLAAVTTRLLERLRADGSTVSVVWLTSRFPPTTTLPTIAPISIVIPDTITPQAVAGYDQVAERTGGIVIATVASIDTASERLLSEIAPHAARRADGRKISDPASVRRAIEREPVSRGMEWEPVRGSYLALIEQYLTGDADAAVEAVSAVPAEQLPADSGSLLSRAHPEAVIALHTEAAIRHSASARWQLDLAQRAVVTLWYQQPGNAVCRHWMLAMSAYEKESLRGMEASIDPRGEPALLVAFGSALEVPTSLETPPGLDRVNAASTDLSRAAEAYRAALAAAPTLTEARVRLGRVLGILQQRQEAIAQLERARSESKDPRLSYLASLFLGEIHEADGDQKGALAAYRAATETCRDGLAARAALARLLESSGQHIEANQVLKEQFAANADQSRARDPWQDYFHGSPDDLARELAALREAARR